MNAAAAKHLAGDGEPAAGIIPATVLDRLSDGECVVIWCQIGHLPGTDAKVVVTRVGSRFETVVHTAEAPLISIPEAMTGTTPLSCTIVRHGPDHVLTTDGHTDAATAERWLAALRTGTATPWTDNADDFDHVRHWILAHAPGGLFTAVTGRGAAIGIGGHAVRAGGVEVAMLAGTDMVVSPRCSTSVTRLHRLIARWRQAGAPYTEQLPAALFRQGDGWRVRLVVPRTEDGAGAPAAAAATVPGEPREKVSTTVPS